MKVMRVAVVLAVTVASACAGQDSPTASHFALSGPASDVSAAGTSPAGVQISIDVLPESTANRIPLNGLELEGCAGVVTRAHRA